LGPQLTGPGGRIVRNTTVRSRNRNRKQDERYVGTQLTGPGTGGRMVGNIVNRSMNRG
jgi:hypothetical protein